MSLLDIEKAYKAFEDYLDGFDRENDRIKLKIVHTYGVVKCASEIAKRLGLSKEDRDLAEVIALLHDIGRFEQVKRFDSFEPCTMDHARYGVELLFGKDTCEGYLNEFSEAQGVLTMPGKMIRRFVPEDDWDEIIKVAIAKHSLYTLGEIEDERTRLHAKLIRDADKLDNCRVKLEDSFEVLLNMSGEEVGALPISDEIWQTCLEHRSILSEDRVTKMDYWVSYIAYFFDINFKETYDIILEEDYVHRIVHRITYTNPDTREKMAKLEEMLGGQTPL